MEDNKDLLTASYAEDMCPSCIPDKTITGLLPVFSPYDLKYAHKDRVNVVDNIITHIPNNRHVLTEDVRRVDDVVVVDKLEDISKYYGAGKYRHGRKDEFCIYQHPKICFKYVKKGKKGHNQGDDCGYHHLKFCRYDTKCHKKDYKSLHPKERKNN